MKSSHSVPFDLILQLVKNKVQQGQIVMPQFFQVSATGDLKLDNTEGTKDQTVKVSVQTAQTVKQPQANEVLSAQTSGQKVDLQKENVKAASQQVQQNNLFSGLLVKSDGQQNQRESQKDDPEMKDGLKQVADLKIDVDRSIFSQKLSTDKYTEQMKNRPEALRKVDTHLSQIGIQMQNLPRQQKTNENTVNEQARLVDEESTKAAPRALVHQSSKNTANQQKQPSEAVLQRISQNKTKESPATKDQNQNTSVREGQNNSQKPQKNKNSDMFSEINEQKSVTQRQVTTTIATQGKTKDAVDQSTTSSSQTSKAKNEPSLPSQNKEQSNKPKVTVAQERSQDQIQTLGSRQDKIFPGELSYHQMQPDRRYQPSEKVSQEVMNTESSKRALNGQLVKDTESKLNKVNSKATQVTSHEGQEPQRIPISKNTIDHLNSQVQGTVQSIADNFQRAKDRSTQRVSQQGNIIAENLISSKVSEGSTKPQTNTVTFKQAQVVVRNMILQIQDSTSEFTQLKQIKREIPNQLKTSEPIKIETFKLEIAKELKKDSQPIVQQPQIEKFEQTQQLKELLNTKLARRTYENENTVQIHQEFQRDIDSVITRIEQQNASSNIQTLVQTIKEMQNATIERATVDLTPPTLGKVEIEIIKQQDKLMITLKVASDETREILEKSSKDLVSRLNTLGFKVEQVDVKTSQKTQEDQLQRDQAHDHQQQQRQKRNQQEEVNEDDQRD